jgi:hypothetical protein
MLLHGKWPNPACHALTTLNRLNIIYTEVITASSHQFALQQFRIGIQSTDPKKAKPNPRPLKRAGQPVYRSWFQGSTEMLSRDGSKLIMLATLLVISAQTTPAIAQSNLLGGMEGYGDRNDKAILAELAKILAPVPNLVFVQRYCQNCSVQIDCPITGAAAFHYAVSYEAATPGGNSVAQVTGHSSNDFILTANQAAQAFGAMRGKGILNYWITRHGKITYRLKIALRNSAAPNITFSNSETLASLMELKRESQLLMRHPGKEHESARMLARIGKSIPDAIGGNSLSINLSIPESQSSDCAIEYQSAFSSIPESAVNPLPQCPVNFSRFFYKLAERTA